MKQQSTGKMREADTGGGWRGRNEKSTREENKLT